MMKTGYITKGAAISSTIAPSSSASCNPRLITRAAAGAAASVAGSSEVLAISALLSEQTCGAQDQHDRHDDEDHDIGGLGVEHLGQPLGDAQQIARHDGSHDRAHAADHHHREHHDDDVR